MTKRIKIFRAKMVVSVVLLSDTDVLCMQEIQQDSTEFNLTFPAPGFYTFENSYYDEIKTIQLRVQ